ncbi:hypothetical protein [Sphingobacterium humi]|uniref:Uncharacterized protein n=1 Tax=Sphingobacterium humi TaxID=1796905 RepID=A0A6N8KU65_9SPHI|nr:hypothetical protein [Sphingobacterium humi]MVZ60627.1 hypothetical protein [Sphingobacterium humi]
MKGNQGQNGGRPVNTGKQHMPVQNKDNLDSREHEEQQVKGDDMTHNKKEKKSENKENK